MAVVGVCVAAAAGCRKEEPEPPGVATPSFSVKQTRVPLGSPVEVTYKFVVANDAPKITEDFRVFVHFLDADNERTVDRRSRSADPDDAVEAGADHRIHQDDVRADRAVRGHDQSAHGALLERLGHAPSAGWHRSTISVPTSSAISICCRRPRAFSSCSRKAGTRRKRRPTTPPSNGSGRGRKPSLSVRNPKKDVMLYLHLDSPGLFRGTAAGDRDARRSDDRLVRARTEERADSQAHDHRRPARNGRCGGSEDFGR